jgi:hypothetical protein
MMRLCPGAGAINHLLGTRSFPSSDDSDNSFSRIPLGTQTQIVVNQNTPVPGTVCAYLCPQFFCLLKLIAHVCTPKMAEDGLSVFSAFTMLLYLAFRSRWLDLTHGISGVWVLGPKLKFHI